MALYSTPCDIMWHHVTSCDLSAIYRQARGRMMSSMSWWQPTWRPNWHYHCHRSNLRYVTARHWHTHVQTCLRAYTHDTHTHTHTHTDICLHIHTQTDRETHTPPPHHFQYVLNTEKCRHTQPCVLSICVSSEALFGTHSHITQTIDTYTGPFSWLDSPYCHSDLW